jgi:hypothetical protein
MLDGDLRFRLGFESDYSNEKFPTPLFFINASMSAIFQAGQ